MANTSYTTTGGENWGTIAYLAYGTISEIIVDGVSVSAIKVITDANPTVPITPLLPSGIILTIPIIIQPLSTLDPILLPPWKR